MQQNTPAYGGHQPPAPPVYQPGGPGTPPAPAAAVPMRIAFVAAGALVFLLIAAFATLFNGAYQTGYQLMLLAFPLLLGCALCLLLREEGLFKGIAAGILALAPFIATFGCPYALMSAQVMARVSPLNVLRGPVFAGMLTRSYVEAVIVGVAGVVLLFAHKGEWRKKVVLAAWISAGLILLFSIFQQRGLLFFSLNPAGRTFANFVYYILEALAPALAVYPLLMLATLKPDRLQTGTGAKVWLWFCVAVNTVSVIITFPARVGNVAQAMVVAVAVGGYLLLIFGRRVGFPLLLLAVGTSILANIRMSLVGGYPSVGGVVSSLVGIVNPLITWVVIHNAWQAETPAPQPAAIAPAGAMPQTQDIPPVAAGSVPAYPPGVSAPPAPPAPQAAPVPQAGAAPPAPAGPAPALSPPRQVLSFLATTGAPIDPTDPLGQQYANKLHAFAREQLAAASPRFAQWFTLVQQQNTPHKVGFGAGQTKEALNAAFKSWLLQEGVLPADLNTAIGDTLFLQAGDATDPATGQSSTWCVYIYFAQ